MTPGLDSIACDDRTAKRAAIGSTLLAEPYIYQDEDTMHKSRRRKVMMVGDG